MIGAAATLRRATRIAPSFSLHRQPPSLLSPPPLPPPSSPPLLPFTRSFSSSSNGPIVNPIALQMINYALSLSRSQKSDESYSQGLLVLEQCHSTQQDENSKGIVLLAMSTLLSERGNLEEAIEKLQTIQDLGISYLPVRVAATEALVGLHLELGQDNASSALVDIYMQVLETIKVELGACYGSEVLDARVKALKGLVEFARGNIESAEAYFHGPPDGKIYSGTAALSYGEFLHAMREFSSAKELYQKAIQGIAENKNFSDQNNLAACNMAPEEVLLAATCALGQLEGHMGNFGDAEEILTTALKETEEHFGSHHPKVGVILTCIALMFGQKATMEHSSSLLIQEGLYRRAIDLLKAPSLETEGAEAKLHRRDIVALARGGYADILCVQQNRKAQGERMKSWANAAWRNRRLSLADALQTSSLSSKVLVIDARISRVL